MPNYHTQSASNFNWRAFYTCSRAEKKCEHRLKEKKIDVFLPIQTVIRQWKDRKKAVQVPIFRNYIFARVDEHERIDVLRTPGVVSCIAFGGILAEIKQEEIDQIKILQTSSQQYESIQAPQKLVGAEIRINRGTLRGLKGEVLEIRGESRLLVRITSLKMAIKVEVPYSITKYA
jgi:transcription antitermination factor NusG